MLNQNDTAILIIDIQEKLLNAVFNKETLEKKAKIITKASKLLNLPLFITEQYPQGLGESISGIKDNTKAYVKTDFNAINDIELLNDIKATNCKNIVILGIETHICVYQTASALFSEGFNVTVINDACGSRSEFEYNTALNSMRQNGIQIKSTEMLLFELLKTAKHPNFKEIQSLIK